jgi:HEPN superfamily AbiU2-like protein
MKKAPPKARCYQATDALAEELLLIKSSLDTYRLIGLNASSIVSGKLMFGHLQRLSLLNVALGLAKVFEREEEGGYELCSVSGVLRVAKSVPIEEIAAVHAFASRYGAKRQDEWIAEIDDVFAKQRPTIARHMRLVTKARNTRIAHLQQAAPIDNLPSIAAFEELLEFAVRFHAFVNRAFLATSAHPILSDERVGNSLAKLLKLAGVNDVVHDFPNSRRKPAGGGGVGRWPLPTEAEAPNAGKCLEPVRSPLPDLRPGGWTPEADRTRTLSDLLERRMGGGLETGRGRRTPSVLSWRLKRLQTAYAPTSSAASAARRASA